MAEKKSFHIPFQEETGALATALAEKGTPGLILLGAMFFVLWVPPVLFTILFYSFIPKVDPDKHLTIWFSAGYLFFCLIALGVLAGFAYGLTKSAMQSIAPTIRAEAEASTLMSKAFGGKDFNGYRWTGC